MGSENSKYFNQVIAVIICLGLLLLSCGAVNAQPIMKKQAVRSKPTEITVTLGKTHKVLIPGRYTKTRARLISVPVKKGERPQVNKGMAVTIGDADKGRTGRYFTLTTLSNNQAALGIYQLQYYDSRNRKWQAVPLDKLRIRIVAAPIVPGPVAKEPSRVKTYPVFTEKPDLVITRAELYVGNPGQSGQQVGIPIYTHSRVLISLTARNQGAVDADLSSTVYHWKLEGSNPDIKAVGSLGKNVLAPGEEAGGGVFFLNPGDVPPGDYTLTVTVDPENKAAESNEANNSVTLNMTVLESQMTGTPDLVVSNVIQTAALDTPCADNADGVTVANVEVTVANVGDGHAYIHNNFIARGEPYLYCDMDAGYYVYINPGESRTVTLRASIPRDVPPGTVQSVITVDPSGNVAESNEDNNTYNLQIQVPDFSSSNVDLAVTGVSFNPENPTTEDRVMIHVDMQNIGTETAHFCIGTLEWMSNSDPPGAGGGGRTMQKRTVGPGETFGGGLYIIEPGEFSPGCITITATVDPDDAIVEMNEANNHKTVTLIVQGPADKSAGTGPSRLQILCPKIKTIKSP